MEERILILAPRGRDAQVICGVLAHAGAKCHVCGTLQALQQELRQDAVGGFLVTEETLTGPELPMLLTWLDDQPPWSDLPVIVLATKQVGPRARVAAHLLSRLGNVTLLERPINAETLASAVRGALRARRRQYQARALLQQEEAGAVALRQLNETLEERVEQRARELESARETLDFALDSAEMGSWDLDLPTGHARRSARFDRIFGYGLPVVDWSRKKVLDHVVDEEREAAAKAFDAAVLSGELNYECRIMRRDGVVRWIVLKGRFDYDPTGAPVRVAGVVMDTTEQRHTEDALRQAQKMEAIGQLTGGVAHDFNNLLTVIVGGLDMLIRRPDDPARVVRLADSAMVAARRGEQLTQQLLAFSRRQVLRPETLDPNQLLVGFERLAERAVGESVILSMDLDPEAYPIRIDPAQFEAAVLNMIVNARDAMPQGGRIVIRTGNVHLSSASVRPEGLAPGPYVMVSVTDDGMGMGEQTLSRVFEPFFTTKDVGKGSGLGLAQVYGFTRSAGGSVAIQSRLGEGTTVQLFFPRSAEAVTEERQAATVPLRRAVDGETILLVQDDAQVLGMAIESLEEMHYKVIVARDAHEALAHLEGEDRIDILFSDVVMPGGMNGTQLAVKARRLRPELKVLLTSGYVGDLGADQLVGEDLPLLAKPYRRDELAQKLRLVLGADQGASPSE